MVNMLALPLVDLLAWGVYADYIGTSLRWTNVCTAVIAASCTGLPTRGAELSGSLRSSCMI